MPRDLIKTEKSPPGSPSTLSEILSGNSPDPGQVFELSYQDEPMSAVLLHRMLWSAQ